MRHACCGGPDEEAIRPTAATLGPADWLAFAASPTFAVMALLTALVGDPMAMMCSGGPGTSLLSGMAVMYLLMSAFHAAPWLKLIRANARRPG